MRERLLTVFVSFPELLGCTNKTPQLGLESGGQENPEGDCGTHFGRPERAVLISNGRLICKDVSTKDSVHTRMTRNGEVQGSEQAEGIFVIGLIHRGSVPGLRFLDAVNMTSPQADKHHKGDLCIYCRSWRPDGGFRIASPSAKAETLSGTQQCPRHARSL